MKARRASPAAALDATRTDALDAAAAAERAARHGGVDPLANLAELVMDARNAG